MIPERYAPYVYPLFRIVFGALFLCHGLQKFGLLHTPMVPLLTRSGAAAVIELVCGAMIAVGFFAGPAAFLACGEMAFAYFLVHHPRGWLPIENRGEAAVLYCFAFLYIAARGGGKLAINRR